MIPSIMLYGAVLGVLLAGAAHFMDLALRTLGRPVRWIWVGAMAGTAIAPLVSVLLPRNHGTGTAAGEVIPLDTLYELWRGVAPGGPGSDSILEVLDGPILLAWISASMVVILLSVGTALRLRGQARVWPREHVGGEEVLISDGLGPAVLGLLFPRIVLPPWALSLDPEELEMVVLHEAEHRQARDPALLACGIATLALAPWNPALWWSLGRLRLAVEGDCDCRVLARGVSRKRYGHLLLGVAAGARGLFPLAPALVEGGPTFLERRLRMMKNRVGKRSVAGAAIAVAVGGLFLALACETPTPPQAGVESVEEPSPDLARNPGLDGEAAWSFRQGDDSGGASSPEGVVLKRITEDGAESPEGGRAGFRSEDQGTPKVLIRTGEPPAGARKVMEADPLILIDGVIVQNENGKAVLGGLDPDRIERIEVIRGKAAEALYGEAAANGVIQVYLKKK
jgi:hypothetical protein